MTYEKNARTSLDSPQRFNKTGKVPVRIGELRRIAVTSASAITSDYPRPPGGVNVQLENRTDVFVLQKQEYGQTVGITSNTASNLDDFAIFSRMTGALSDRLTGSDTSWFLTNEFGTPFLPLSSGSGEEPSFDVDIDVSKNLQVLADVISPTPTVSRALTLRAVLANKGLTSRTRDIFAAATTASL